MGQAYSGGGDAQEHVRALQQRCIEVERVNRAMARTLEERDTEVKGLRDQLGEARAARDSAQDSFMDVEKQLRALQESRDTAADEVQTAVEERSEELEKEVARLDLEVARLSDECALAARTLEAARAETRAAEEAYAKTVGGLRAKNAELRRRLQGMQEVLVEPEV